MIGRNVRAEFIYQTSSKENISDILQVVLKKCFDFELEYKI